MQRLEGPPPLIPIFDVEDTDEDSSQRIPVLNIKNEPNFPNPNTLTVLQYSQSNSRVTLGGEDSLVNQQDFRLSIHESFENREVPFVNNYIIPNCLPKENRRLSQLNQISVPLKTLDSFNNIVTNTASENVEVQPERPTSPIIDEFRDPRIEFIINDPLILQDIVFREKCRASSDEIDPDHHLHPFQVAAFFRLRRMYQRGLISVRLDGETNKRIVVASKLIDLDQVLPSSIEVNEFLTDWTSVPTVVVEMISTSTSVGLPTRFLMLNRDKVHEYWELIGCLGPLDPPVTPICERPPDLPFPAFQQKECTEPPLNDSYTCVEVTPDLIIDYPSSNEAATPETNAVESPPVSHIPENETNDTMLANNPILQGLLSCPEFLLSSPSTNNNSSSQLLELTNTITDNGASVENWYNSIWPLLEKTVFKCGICQKELPSKQSLKRHSILHDPTKWKSCHLCDYKSPYHSMLKQHLKKNHPEDAQ